MGFTPINGVLGVYLLQLVGYLEDHPIRQVISNPPCLYGLAILTLVLKTTETSTHRDPILQVFRTTSTVHTTESTKNHRGTKHRWHAPRNLRLIFLQFVLLLVFAVFWFCFFSKSSYPIGSMGLVYLPTWMVDFYGKCRWICHTWILWV